MLFDFCHSRFCSWIRFSYPSEGQSFCHRWFGARFNNIAGSAATGSGTPVAMANPQVFSFCWGTSVPTNCGVTPSRPPMAPGISFVIKADIASMSGSGKVRCVFKDGATIISDQNIEYLGEYPGGGFWSPFFNFTMPNRDIPLTVEAYGWDGTNWVLTHSAVTVISSIPTCTTIGLLPYTATVVAGGTVDFTATITPSTTVFTVNFKLSDGTLIGSKTTTGGVALFTWTTPSGVGATYYVHAEVGSPVQCTSNVSTIVVSPPIRQWNLNITVKDVNTNNPISGATVIAKGQTKTTDTNGYVTFRLDEGTVDISISKTGYNTYTTTESLFSDLTKIYFLAPVVPTTGNLRFITVPTAADVYLYSETTKRGTTDSSTGVLLISNLTAGAAPYTIKKTGYNNSVGTTTVVGGVTTDVYVTLTLVTPTTGSVCLKSTPSGASIDIDGSATGKTTALSTGGCTSSNTVDNLSPGNHSYTLKLTGYEDKTGTFLITAGTTIIVDVGTLTPITGVGTLEITSNPVGARVYIDNVDKERVTPATIINIPAGSHAWKLALSGYENKTGTFSITTGLTTTINAGNLTPVTPVTAGGGTILIAAVALLAAVMLMRRKPPSPIPLPLSPLLPA